MQKGQRKSAFRLLYQLNSLKAKSQKFWRRFLRTCGSLGPFKPPRAAFPPDSRISESTTAHDLTLTPPARGVAARPAASPNEPPPPNDHFLAMEGEGWNNNDGGNVGAPPEGGPRMRFTKGRDAFLPPVAPQMFPPPSSIGAGVAQRAR